MTRTVYPGAWYADATPHGSFVVLVPQSHLQTHLGRVDLPPNEPWGIGFVRCTDEGGFAFAGQAHSTLTPACWEWDVTDGWRPLVPPCVGVSPCIYDFDGVLHRSDGSVGSQGYRYVAPHGPSAGTLISGDATYRYPTGQLYEYSAAGDLWIGQAAYDGGGVQVLTPDGVLRQLELGDDRFIRVQVGGERVSLAWMASIGAVVIQTTLAELRALPPVVTSQPPAPTPVPPAPPVPPPPVPAPSPPPEGHPMPPSFDQWIKHEYPQVVAAYQYGHPQPDGRPGTDRPSDEWAAFQTLRRYSGFIPGMGEAWTLQQMIAHERSVRPADAPPDPTAPPNPQ